MRNDVRPPPIQPNDRSAAVPNSRRAESKDLNDLGPVKPGPDKTIADVTLFDQPSLNPGGSGNFWSLGLFMLIAGVFMLAIVATLWLFFRDVSR